AAERLRGYLKKPSGNESNLKPISIGLVALAFRLPVERVDAIARDIAERALTDLSQSKNPNIVRDAAEALSLVATRLAPNQAERAVDIAIRAISSAQAPWAKSLL